MRFVVDAHLPPGLCALFREAGHEAIHTTCLVEKYRTPDRFLNKLSLSEERVVVTKDTDFFYSHVLHGTPWKLLLVRTGNARVRDLKALFGLHMPEIIAALEEHTLVELDWQSVRAVL
jgi:predicted nuclease of predicted toxin-antitoxin system